LGESVIEATITRWHKAVGDTVEEDDSIVEIATDKVDSEIPSPVEGKIIELFYAEGDVVPVGKVIAIVEMDGDEGESEAEAPAEKPASTDKSETKTADKAEEKVADDKKPVESAATSYADSDRFYSPLVKQIAKTENISLEGLEVISGSGKDGRVTKNDMLSYLDNRTAQPKGEKAAAAKPADAPAAQAAPRAEAPKVTAGTGDQIIEMDRMRRLIADHMVMS
jgi:2-oxoglutarate dehydrogenase E2 component (dihydrolipoamide succinyltransferase)